MFGTHTIDHMASNHNCKAKSGRFFSRFFVQGTMEVNVFTQRLKNKAENAYCFPPFSMVGAYLEFSIAQEVTVSVVVMRKTYEHWWPICTKKATFIHKIADKGDTEALVSNSGKLYPLKGPLFVIRFTGN
eukprot:Lithocolla_globosa_v1_NODE_591_length_3661_cov_41.346644.p4 type:complete len:130 gc:universal NODE_591_length_3661_cov_41.346644:3243-3632(+)